MLAFPSANELYPASLSAFYDDVLVNVSLLYADAASFAKRTTSDLREDLQQAFAGYDPPLVQDYLDAPSLQNASDAYAEKAAAFANVAYEASCDVDGNPLVEGDFRALVRADLKRRLRAWLCVGRLKVMGAVLVHAAWVAPLARLRRDVAYAPH